jgi:hypothetical protein
MTAPVCPQGLLRKFSVQKDIWTGAVDALAQVDALMSLAAAAELGGTHGAMCRPTFLPPDEASGRQVNKPTLWTCIVAVHTYIVGLT